jgi:DNA repair protein RadC
MLGAGMDVMTTHAKEPTADFSPARGRGVGPRERLADHGTDALSDEELLALLLGTGSVSEPVGLLANRLLSEYGALEGLARAGVGELCGRRGLGWAKAARVAAALELGRRAASAARRPSFRLRDASAVEEWALGRLSMLDHEELWLLALDAANGLRAARRVAQGGLHGLSVSARDPLRIALREGASAFILVHNHPSGDPTPSREDIDFTERMARAADVVGTPLVDHVVVTRDASISMLEKHLVLAFDDSERQREGGDRLRSWPLRGVR